MSEWDSVDKALLALNGALGGWDWGYTQWAVGHDRGPEANRKIGKNASRAQLDQHFGKMAALAAGSSAALPEEHRKAFLAASAALQFANYHGLLHGNPRMDQTEKARETGAKGALAGALAGFGLSHLLDDSGISVEVKKGPKGAIETMFGIKKEF